MVRKRLKLHAVATLNNTDDSPDYLNIVIFTHESMVLSINTIIVEFGSLRNPSHEIVQYQRDSPKVNVWCGLMHDKVLGPFIFAENTINGDIY